MIVAAGFIISQLITYHVEDIQHLWKASVILGGSYGMLFGLYPTLVIEWFGLGERVPAVRYHRGSETDRLGHFSENWGFVSLAPAFGKWFTQDRRMNQGTDVLD